MATILWVSGVRARRPLLFAASLLAVATTSAVFMVVGTVISPAVAVPQAWEVVWVRSQKPGSPVESLTRAEVKALKEAGVFSGGFGFRDATLTVELNGAGLAVAGLYVEPGFLGVLGMNPRAGREFLDGENRAGGAVVCLVSERFWQEELGKNPEALGIALTINGKVFTVVGVVPNLSQVFDADVFLPEAHDPDAQRPPNAFRNRFFLARLAAGTGVKEAQEAVSGLLSRSRSLAPPGEEGVDFQVLPLPRKLLAPYARFLPALVLGCALVWLLGQVGMGFALAVEMAERQGEAAVRVACGAGRPAVTWDLAAPAALAVGAGGLAGVGLGVVVGRLLAGVAALDEFVSVRSWLWCLGAGGAVLASQLALAFALGWRFSHRERCESYFRGAFGSRPRGLSLAGFRGLLLAEASLAGALLLLLVGAQLVLAKLASAQRRLPLDRLAVCKVVVNRMESAASLLEIYERVVEAAKSLPGVRGVTLASGLADLAGVEPMEVFPVSGEGREVLFFNVYPGFFQSLGLPLAWGREFSATDSRSSMPVVMLTTGLAARLCPKPGLVPCYVFWGRHRQRALVVGAVQEMASQRTGEALEALYIPLTQDPRGRFYVLALLDGPAVDATGLFTTLRHAEPRVTVFPAVRGSEAVRNLQWGPRMRRLFLALLSFSGVLFAVVGWAAVAALFVLQRQQEWWVRRALGANAGQLAGSFLTSAGLPLAVGLLAGVGCAALPLVWSRGAALFGLGISVPKAALSALGLGLMLMAAALAPSLWLQVRLSGERPR